MVVDGRVAYTGSMNLVDPRCFKQGAGVGEWVDAMARAEGPIVGALRAVFLFDWGMQTGETPSVAVEDYREAWAAARGRQVAQVVMSGPGTDETANLRLITQAIGSARRSIVLTTPYFVADAALALALENAALRGCEVTLIVPDRNDSWLVEYASRWFFEDLTDAGVRIRRYTGGLLHTKSITVDGAVSLFGTANLDIRSLSLNFELMLAIYDAEFTERLLALQRSYETQSVPVAPEAVAGAPAPRAAQGRLRLHGGAAAVSTPRDIEMSHAPRIEAIESKLAHLERALQELSDVVYRQQREIDAALELNRNLRRQVEELENRSTDAGAVEIPPHY